MMFNVPMTQVPNTQSFPDNAYPASAYYGVNSTLASFDQFGGSASAVQGEGPSSLMPAQTRYGGLVTAFLVVIGAVVLWHFYYK
jgi:hypothetical protein